MRNIKVNKITVAFLPMLFLCANINTVNASEDPHFSAEFNKGINTATVLQGQAFNQMQNFKPEKVIKGYSTNPKETAYQANPDSIKNDAITGRNTDKTAKAINESIATHPKFNIDPTSPEMTNIQNRSDNVYDVITGQFGDCTKQTSCATTYDTKTCNESPKSSMQYCQKILNIDLIPKQVDTHYSLTLHLSTRDHNYAGVNVNSVNGNINFVGPHDARFSFDGRLPPNLDCHGLSGKLVKINSSNTHIDYMNFPSCASGMNLDFHVSGSGNVNMQIQVDIVSSKIIQEPKDRWEDGCIGLANSGICTAKEEHCVSPNSTRDINGTAVTRDCWEKESTYQCFGNSTVSGCQSYRDQGCEQTASVCNNKQDGGCTLYTQTFQCPIKQCTDTGVICNGNTYCLTGDCVKQNKQADPDFQKGISGLSAVSEAAKSYSANPGGQFPIFGGVVKSCNKDFLNFANCCSESGWGVDIHLGQCDQESKDLGEAKEHGLTVYVDREDSCPIGGFCSHKKKYCVFSSKLARIIQEQGRRDQLHVSLGDFDHADCRGLTPDEFSKLDLNKINFSDFYAEITQKVQLENKDVLNQRMNTKMQQWVQEKTPHG